MSATRDFPPNLRKVVSTHDKRSTTSSFDGNVTRVSQWFVDGKGWWFTILDYYPRKPLFFTGETYEIFFWVSAYFSGAILVLESVHPRSLT